MPISTKTPKNSRSPRLLAILVLTVCFIGFPVSAWAQSARYDFKIQNISDGQYHRYPGSSSSDKTSSGASSGRVSSDATGSSCSASYGYYFKRNIKNFPDYKVYAVNSRAYCSGVQSASVKLTKGHRYYFSVLALRVSPVINSNVYVKWSD